MPLRTARSVVDALAVLVWLGNSRAVATTRTNIDLCFPELGADARATLAKQSFICTARLLAEAGMLFHWPRERWSALLTVTGDQYIQHALAAGRGVLILAPHFGNWECLALYLGRFSATALYDPPNVVSLEKPLREARQRSGTQMLPINRKGLRAIYAALAGGGVTALLPDQVPARSAGVYVPFFGRSALTMTFAHRLIQRTQPLVLLGAARRTRSGFSIEFTRLSEDIHAADPLVSTAAMNRAVETLVRTDPAQYQWEYKRFRRAPRGEPDPYRRRDSS